MFIFGWGRRNTSKTLSANEALILTYSYFSLMLVFFVSFKYNYSLATASKNGWQHKAITKEEAGRLTKNVQFKPHWWRRFSLLIFLVLLAITITTGVLVNGNS